MTSYTTDGESTRTIKAALRKAFPKAIFKVTRGGSRIEWTDDGPSVEQVKSALIAANCVTTWKDFRGDLVFEIGRINSIWFDRYNVAERAAYQEDLLRRRRESEAREQRENDAVKVAALAKRDVMRAPDGGFLRQPAVPPTSQHVHDAFESLRQRAEADVGIDVDRKVRPSWAPPLILEGELLEACIALDLLKPDDAPIARLWAGFADPKATGSILREQRSRHTLSGITCRGFQLHAGSERGPTHAMLFEAQRTESGEWHFGPRVRTSDYYSPRHSEWERLVRERERYQSYHSIEPDPSIERITERLAAIDAQDKADAEAHHKRQGFRVRAAELAKARVLEFAGAPGVQMALAGRLCGHCFNCWRELTDPISLERGIGPECLENKVMWIKLMREEMNVPTLAFYSGMPEEFVIEVLSGLKAQREDAVADNARP